MVSGSVGYFVRTFCRDSPARTNAAPPPIGHKSAAAIPPIARPPVVKPAGLSVGKPAPSLSSPSASRPEPPASRRVASPPSTTAAVSAPPVPSCAAEALATSLHALEGALGRDDAERLLTGGGVRSTKEVLAAVAGSAPPPKVRLSPLHAQTYLSRQLQPQSTENTGRKQSHKQESS